MLAMHIGFSGFLYVALTNMALVAGCLEDVPFASNRMDRPGNGGGVSKVAVVLLVSRNVKPKDPKNGSCAFGFS